MSYLGPALGGGHGWLQGRYGLVSDQFVSWNVVLASGELVTVTKDSDLFWAMKGAGHNFGIVTSVTSKIYDIVRPNYAMTTLFFTGAQVESVYQTANEQWLTKGKTMPVDLINWSYWFYDPTIDPTGVSRDLIAHNLCSYANKRLYSPSSRSTSSKKGLMLSVLLTQLRS